MDLAIIDADSIAYAIASSMQRSVDEDLEPEPTINDFAFTVNNYLANIEDETDCRDYRMFLSGSSNFRYSIYPEYKAQRKDVEKPRYLKAVRECMIEDFGAEMADEGFEADDEVAQVAIDYYKDGSEDECILCSIDKDLDTVPGWHYRWPTYHKPAHLYFLTEEEASHLYWVSTLTGDTADNIKGLPGIGPKKAEGFLMGCNDDPSYYDAVEAAYFEVLSNKGWKQDDIHDYFKATVEIMRMGKEGRDV